MSAALAQISAMVRAKMGSTVKVGDTVAGKYRVTALLGQGGMGVVMAAEHLQLKQRVALKFLTAEAYQSAEATARFLREARLAVQIQSEHVARVLDVGTLESGAPYMVMEYLAGEDLKNIADRGALLPQDAVDHLLQACDAVAEAHALGIIHRDLKPANLFLTTRPDGTALVKVLDFGISKATQAGDGPSVNMTASTAIMGSPQYMSPEQIRSSRNVDPRTDIWALGTILHELLSGSPAYEADTLPGLLAKIIADPPKSLSDSNPELAPRLRKIVETCLEKNADRRYPTLSHLANELQPFASPEVAPLAARIARLLRQPAPGSVKHQSTERLVAEAATPGKAKREKAKPEQSDKPNVRTNGSWATTGSRPKRKPQLRQTARRVVLFAAFASIGVASWFSLSVPPEPATSPTGAAAILGLSPTRIEQPPQLAPAPSPAAKPAIERTSKAVPTALTPAPVLDTPAAAPAIRLVAAPEPASARRPKRRPKVKKRVSASKARRVSTRRTKAAPSAPPRIRAQPKPKQKPTENKLDSLDLFNDTK